MSYQISPGISEDELSDWLAAAAKKFGKFSDGRIDYTHADIAPVVMCTVIYQDRILLAKRGYGLAEAEGYWSTIDGFIDEDKPITKIAAQELQEETGLEIPLHTIKVGKSYRLKNPQEKRIYIVFPCLVVLDKGPQVTLDREHTEYAWVKRQDIEQYHILDDLPYAIDQVLQLL